MMEEERKDDSLIARSQMLARTCVDAYRKAGCDTHFSCPVCGGEAHVVKLGRQLVAHCEHCMLAVCV